MECILNMTDSYGTNAVTVGFLCCISDFSALSPAHFLPVLTASISKTPDSDREETPLTFRVVLKALTSPLSPCLRMFEASRLSPPFRNWRKRFPAGCLYRGFCFRSIDPSDVQSRRLISAVPGVCWRWYRSELDCLFSQITALRGVFYPLSHSQEKKPVYHS